MISEGRYTDEDDFYSDDVVEELSEADELSASEAGFMHGWIKAGRRH